MPDEQQQSSGRGMIESDDHLLPIEEIIAKYETNVNLAKPLLSQGLTEADLPLRLEKYGRNALTPPKKESNVLKYFKKVAGLFNLLLILAGIMAIILYFIDTSAVVNIYLGAILIAVAFINALIEFYQEHKTSAILESFKSLVAQSTMVVRNSRMETIEAAEIFPGDVIILKLGDRIPADLRLFTCTDMKVDNSSITGESEPQERNLHSTATNILEATNMAFSGSTIVSGEGAGIVVRTGDHSVLGKIANLTMSNKKRVSQLHVETDVFVKRTAVIAFITALIFFVYGLVSSFGIGVTFSFAIGTFVAFIPQGLPVTVTLLLTIAAKRLSKRNVLVKDLTAVETLGSITVLATDKTGTLTQNKMSVVSVWMSNTVYGAGLEKADEKIIDSETSIGRDLLDVCALCAKSKFDPSENELSFNERKIYGDATEVGIIRFAGNYVDVVAKMENANKVFEIPFNSTNKWHLTIIEQEHEDGDYIMMIKGAPERVKKMCNSIRVGDDTHEWDNQWDVAFDQAYENFAGKGRRVLAFAHAKLPRSMYPKGYEFSSDPLNFNKEEFVFLGLLGLMDPPKHGVRKAVAALRTAGIQLIMVTGDHPLTAEAIARNIGLIQGQTIHDASKKLLLPPEAVDEDQYDAVVVHGDEIDSWEEKDWDRVLSKLEIVFARTSPKHKLEIVTRLQAKGHIVGVSGDGVNDSPALKKADLGISMNLSASDVSKEAAAMILLDDNFPTIVAGIHEGRLIFVNLKKSIRYTLTHIMPEVLSFLIFIIFAIPLPISSILVLMIDLGSELGPAISFAYELPEGDLMLVPPRKALVKAKVAEKPKEKKKHWWNRKKNVDVDLEAASVIPENIEVQPDPIPQTSLAEDIKGSSKSRFRVMCTRVADKFRVKGSGEMLVDSDLVLWSYFQGGIIETIGCMASYLVVLWYCHAPFDNLYKSALTYWQDGAPPLQLSNGTIADADQQVYINNQAQAAFYVTLVITQWFNIFICKHRYEYPWGWDLFKNYRTYIGIACSAAVAAIVIYVPGVNNIIFQTAPAPIVSYIAPVATGLLLFVYETIRRFLRKRGYFGGVPKKNVNLVDLVRTTSTMQ